MTTVPPAHILHIYLQRCFHVKYKQIDSGSDIGLIMTTTKPSKNLRLIESDSEGDDIADNENIDPDKTLTSGDLLSDNNVDGSSLTDPSILAESDDAPANTSLALQCQSAQSHIRSSTSQT
ncbi:hypothetical protein CF319_g6609 [Tilletia indica]|nr:hypothetical protein CF319_g6609 [Tilletia indica]